MTNQTLRGELDGSALRIGVVTSFFNNEITYKLLEGALSRLMELGVKESNVISVQVPGAFEIPLAAKALFDMQKVDGVIALGAVIRGETTHYDYVCQAVERGCSTLAIEIGKPVGFGVLTTENEKQAEARVGGTHGHKGKETAEVVVEICNLLKALQKPASVLDAHRQREYNDKAFKEVSP